MFAINMINFSHHGALVWPIKYHQLFEFPSQFSHLFWSSHQLFVTLTCHLKIKSESKQFEIAFINLAKLGDGVDESPTVMVIYNNKIGSY